MDNRKYGVLYSATSSVDKMIYNALDELHRVQKRLLEECDNDRATGDHDRADANCRNISDIRISVAELGKIQAEIEKVKQTFQDEIFDYVFP